jgi:hypothetical protein
MGPNASNNLITELDGQIYWLYVGCPAVCCAWQRHKASGVRLNLGLPLQVPGYHLMKPLIRSAVGLSLQFDSHYDLFSRHLFASIKQPKWEEQKAKVNSQLFLIV